MRAEVDGFGGVLGDCWGGGVLKNGQGGIVWSGCFWVANYGILDSLGTFRSKNHVFSSWPPF